MPSRIRFESIQFNLDTMDKLVYGMSLYFDGLSTYYKIKRERFSEKEFKKTMQRKNITLPQLARYLCVTPPRAWQILNGYKATKRNKDYYFPKIMRYLDEA